VERQIAIQDLAIKPGLSVRLGDAALLEAGAEMHRISSRWQWKMAGLLPTDAWHQASAGGPTVWGQGLTEPVDSRLDATRGALWASGHLSLGGRLVLEPALRLERSSVNRATTPSPRLHASLTLGAGTQLRAAAGRLVQTPGYEKVLQSEYFVELGWPSWTADGVAEDGPRPMPMRAAVEGRAGGPLQSPRSDSRDALRLAPLANERSLGVFVGLERALAGGVSGRVDLYYRRLDDLIIGELEDEADTRARLARYDFPPELQDELPSERQITRRPTSGGRGRAYGLDVFVSRKAGRLRGWVSYTYGVSRRQAYGYTYPSDFDCRHAVSLVGELSLTRTLRLGLTARWTTGLPTTPGRSRVEVVPDESDLDGDGDRHELVPARKPDGSLSYATHQAPGDLELRNSTRREGDQRLDGRLSWNPRGGRWTLYLDVINLLNHKSGDRQTMPFLPSLGVRARF
jgi:hypothetical protein